MTERKTGIKVMVIEDEEDILNLFKDFLSIRGYQTICESDITSIIPDVETYRPDIYLIDYKLAGNTNGIEIAMQILKKYPLTAILFITAYERVAVEISKTQVFYNSNVDVLIKPVKLHKIEGKILEMTNKTKAL